MKHLAILAFLISTPAQAASVFFPWDDEPLQAGINEDGMPYFFKAGIYLGPMKGGPKCNDYPMKDMKYDRVEPVCSSGPRPITPFYEIRTVALTGWGRNAPTVLGSYYRSELPRSYEPWATSASSSTNTVTLGTDHQTIHYTYIFTGEDCGCSIPPMPPDPPTPNPIPLPGAALMLLTAIGGLAAVQRKPTLDKKRTPA